MLEPSWPHMQLVYEILLRFVLSKEVDSRTAKEYFSKKFMIKLLNLFDSEDPRERDYLKVCGNRLSMDTWRMDVHVGVEMVCFVIVDNSAPHLRQIDGVAFVYSSLDQRHVLHICLRDGIPAGCGRATRNSRKVRLKRSGSSHLMS